MFEEYLAGILAGCLAAAMSWLLLFGTSREIIKRARDHLRFQGHLRRAAQTTHRRLVAAGQARARAEGYRTRDTGLDV